ncbi:hypothetical protein H9X96_09610 [Pedobacter sp. N36a]|uniref:hypothetical protein n=1 Tax=Pedobacter sp. N36a TaxID=2767996 RepID=UPI00165744D2|nr:hypothetical protein [Pedobacter sp. N36a]MBC8986033.1 hypothetical protein [Pedobacter sp. N36a]
MKKLLTIICLSVMATFAFQSTSNAQSYKNAIGGRFGAANGVTFKTTLGGNKMIDLIANFRSTDHTNYFRVTGLYEIYNPINNAAGLNWYYGIGGTVGSVKYKPHNGSDLYLAVDGVLGLDYKFADAPINLSLDWKPAIGLVPETDFDASGVGLSIRFTF